MDRRTSRLIERDAYAKIEAEERAKLAKAAAAREDALPPGA